jgi:hypothetical protein
MKINFGMSFMASQSAVILTSTIPTSLLDLVTLSDAAKNVIGIFKSKKAGMALKPLCNNQLHGYRDSTTGQ